MRLSGVCRDLVLSIVARTDALMRRDTGTNSTSLLTSVIAVVNFHWENLSSVESELLLELSLMNEECDSISEVILV